MYVSMWAGFLFLAVVLDAFSRRVVGWAMATHLRTTLVLAALEMARAQRRPVGVTRHSDHGSQPGFKGSSKRVLLMRAWTTNGATPMRLDTQVANRPPNRGNANSASVVSTLTKAGT
jgi:transposase InsO family protein